MKIWTLFLALVLPLAALAGEPAVKQDLRAELVRMEAKDQALRQATPVDVKAIMATDATHTARMKEILAAEGWPTTKLVGEDGAHAAWLLVQHADADPAFQKHALKLMEPLMKKGEIDRQGYAYLWDRVHEPQRYGTQGSCVSTTQWRPNKLESERKVDARRKKMGMPPLSEYVSMASSRMCANWRPKP